MERDGRDRGMEGERQGRRKRKAEIYVEKIIIALN